MVGFVAVEETLPPPTSPRVLKTRFAVELLGVAEVPQFTL